MDGVGVIMIGDQDILVALAGCNWEPSCLVRIKFSCEIHCLEEDKIGVSDCVDNGNWSCSGFGSNWSTFSCADRRPLLGC